MSEPYRTDTPTEELTLEEALGPGSPIVMFEHVSLAFDDTVVLRDVFRTLCT